MISSRNSVKPKNCQLQKYGSSANINLTNKNSNKSNSIRSINSIKVFTPSKNTKINTTNNKTNLSISNCPRKNKK